MRVDGRDVFAAIAERQGLNLSECELTVVRDFYREFTPLLLELRALDVPPVDSIEPLWLTPSPEPWRE